MVSEQQLLAWIRANYELAEPLSSDIHQRVASWTARVTSKEDAYWLRFQRAKYQSQEELEKSARLVWRLGSTAVRVALPVRRTDGCLTGGLLIGAEPWTGTLTHEARGDHLDSLTPAHAVALGRALAEVHTSTELSPSSAPRTIDAGSLAITPLQRLALIARRDCYQASELEAVALRLTGLLSAWDLPTGLCHGDVHLGNVLFQDSVPTLFDFECALGPLAYDLGCYWRKRVLADPDEVEWTNEWQAIIDGYGSIRQLEEEEHRAIPLFAALRAIWTMAMPTLPGCDWGADWLKDPEYFEAHLSEIRRLVELAAP